MEQLSKAVSYNCCFVSRMPLRFIQATVCVIAFIVACRVSSYGVGLNKYKVDSRLRENDEGMALLSAIFMVVFKSHEVHRL